MTETIYSNHDERKPETLSEAIMDLHESLKNDGYENMTPCVMDKSQVGQFFRLFNQRRWPRASCQCFHKICGPVEGTTYRTAYYVKCRHLTRWERAHAVVLQEHYSHIKALSTWSQHQDRPFVSYDKFLMYAYSCSSPCNCTDLLEPSD